MHYVTVLSNFRKGAPYLTFERSYFIFCLTTELNFYVWIYQNFSKAIKQ